MEIFKYTPNWAAVERRLSMKLETDTKDSAFQVIPAQNVKFYYKEKSKSKNLDGALCSICKISAHIPSMCSEKKIVHSKAQEQKDSGIYQPIVNFVPTTVKLTNVPLDVERAEIYEIVRSNSIDYDRISLVYDKSNKKEEFIGIIYIELPSKGVAKKCLSLFDGRKMGVQIVSAVTVENKQRL